MTAATKRLIELAEHLTAGGEIGDGMVAQFHEAAAMARLEQGEQPICPGHGVPLPCGDCEANRFI